MVVQLQTSFQALTTEVGTLRTETNNAMLAVNSRVDNMTNKLEEVIPTQFEATKARFDEITKELAAVIPKHAPDMKKLEDLHAQLVEQLNTRVMPMGNQMQPCMGDLKSVGITQAQTEKNHMLIQEVGALRQATNASIMTSDTTTGGGRPQSTLDADRIFDDTEILNGNESLADIKDWYKRVTININSARPVQSESLTRRWRRTATSLSTASRCTKTQGLHIDSTTNCTR